MNQPPPVSPTPSDADPTVPQPSSTDPTVPQQAVPQPSSTDPTVRHPVGQPAPQAYAPGQAAPQYAAPTPVPPQYGVPQGAPGHPASTPPYAGSGYGQPTSGPGYGQPTSGPGYGQPTSGPGYAPPTSGPGYGQPTSAPPTSGPGYGQPTSAPPTFGPGYGQPMSAPPGMAPPPYGPPGVQPAGRGRLVLGLILVAALFFVISGVMTVLFVTKNDQLNRTEKRLTAQVSQRDDTIATNTTEIAKLRTDLQAMQAKLDNTEQDLTGTRNDRDEQTRQKKVIASCLDKLTTALGAAAAGNKGAYDTAMKGLDKVCNEAEDYL
ncbi:hypothetical protein [Micromonospora sp. NPDC005413]|uniref:hypothetical protein n=1 Tax=Micromonospora sp. NPDC005413 TaxID=3154563 RepID=UPI0033B9E9B4